MFHCTFFGRVLPVILMVLSGMALARQPEQGIGSVNMTGSIIDTACAIAMSDQHQAVEYGTKTTGEMIHDGQGPVLSFRIHLISCSLSPSVPGHKDWSWFSVTFDGKHDDEYFGVTGAEGIGIRVSDQIGNVAQPGVAMPPQPLSAGEQILHYRFQLVKDHHRMRAGKWHTTIRFKVDYN